MRDQKNMLFDSSSRFYDSGGTCDLQAAYEEMLTDKEIKIGEMSVVKSTEDIKITIKPLTPELSADYFDFFDNRAFTDDSPYRCYCQMYQMSKKQAKALLEDTKGQDPRRISREVAEQQIADNVLRGYLAYVDGKAIGWCNANDRANYPIEPVYDVPFYAPVENIEKAVVCFEIAPEYRRRGVATALLNRVIADAKMEGYLAVVSFPIVRNERFEWDFHGPVRLYEKAGFVKVTEADRDGRIIMRKELNKQFLF